MTSKQAEAALLALGAALDWQPSSNTRGSEGAWTFCGDSHRQGYAVEETKLRRFCAKYIRYKDIPKVQGFLKVRIHYRYVHRHPDRALGNCRQGRRILRCYFLGRVYEPASFYHAEYYCDFGTNDEGHHVSPYIYRSQADAKSACERHHALGQWSCKQCLQTTRTRA